jgi:hypothetical protein
LLLDITSGNRMMWPNKNPPFTIFMDKEFNLKIPPDVFGSWFNIPFRDSVFDCVIFDPPHLWGKIGSWGKPEGSDKFNHWYGFFKNRRDMIVSIIKAEKEIRRITTRVCLKWGETKISLWNILGLFKHWKIINQYKTRGRFVRGIYHRGGSAWWITMIARTQV